MSRAEQARYDREIISDIEKFHRCERKIAYPNKRHAENVAQNMRRNNRYGGGESINAYHCAECNQWHMGSNFKKRR